MKFTLKDTKPFAIEGGTKGYLFSDHPKGQHTIAVVEMDGIYPARGSSLNDICTETIYVLDGELTVTVNGEEHVMISGEMIMILPGQSYNVRGKGRALDLITPAWDSKQNHIILPDTSGT